MVATDTRVLAPAGSGHYATRGVGTPKTKSGKRDVPIPPEAERLLRRRYVDTGFPKAGLVFPSEKDPATPVSPSVLLSDFKARMATAGLPVTKIHELRHIAISLLLAKGSEPGVVARSPAPPTQTSRAASTGMFWTTGLMLRRERSLSLAQRAPRTAQCPPKWTLEIVSTQARKPRNERE